jgi:hypothetical protein
VINPIGSHLSLDEILAAACCMEEGSFARNSDDLFYTNKIFEKYQKGDPSIRSPHVIIAEMRGIREPADIQCALDDLLHTLRANRAIITFLDDHDLHEAAKKLLDIAFTGVIRLCLKKTKK